MNDTIRTRLPVQRDMIAGILRKVNVIFDSQPYLNVLYCALFTTAYFGLLRIGEVTESMHVIKARDVHIAKNKPKLMLILRTSKTHWRNKKPQIIKLKKEIISRNKSKAMCLYNALRHYISIRPSFTSIDEQFFVFRDRSPVKSSMVRSLMRKCIELLGIDHTCYSFHGIRAGRSTDLLNMGVSVETIKKLGRWKSNAVYVYLR